MTKDTCDIYCYDEPKVRRVQAALSRYEIPNMAKAFKALADDTRLKVAVALCEEQELCVCDVANIVGSSLATASHHLRTLRELGMATCRKDGKLAFYALADERVRRLVDMASGCPIRIV